MHLHVELYQVYSYMKSIRPGCHTIVILDPQTKELFKKNVIVQYKLDDWSPFEPDPSALYSILPRETILLD